MTARVLRLAAYSDAATVGGAEVALGYVLGAVDPAIEVTVLATHREVGDAIAAHRPGTPVRAVTAPGELPGPRVLAAHVRALRAVRPDVLHSNRAWPWACGYAELAAALMPGIALVTVDHLPVDAAVPRVRRLARRLLATRADAHVAVGERAAREAERLLDLAAGSVRAIPNGVPPAADDDGGPRADSGDHVVIGSIGRLERQKGYDVLVRALAQLPQARVVLVGDGPERADLRALAERLGVADRLEITGWAAEARRRLSGFDVFALPSRWEGLPLVILEAMHAALPVVATDVGSVAEAVHDGRTGLLVAPDDVDDLRAALARLLADEGLRRRLGDAARGEARKRFSARTMAAAYTAVYRSVAAAG